MAVDIYMRNAANTSVRAVARNITAYLRILFPYSSNCGIAGPLYHI